MKCKKCNINEAKFIDRCEDCHCCDDCGKKENLIYYCEGLLCGDCHKVRVIKRINEFNKDTRYTNSIICPYCGYTYDGNDYSSYEDDIICDDCDNTFMYERHVTIEYSTYKKK